MKRRTFLQAVVTAPFIAGLSRMRKAIAATQDEGWRTYEVITKLDITNPSGISRAWVPLPYMEKTDWHTLLGTTWSGNGRTTVITEPNYGAKILYVEWRENEQAPHIEVINSFATRNRAADFIRSNPGSLATDPLSQREIERYTKPTELIPTDGIVRDTARNITRLARSDIEKAYAIYEWVVENTFRDPKVNGCGWGDIKTMLETGYFGGKCGDLNALFVGLTRSVGVAARDVYGLRVAPSRLGYKSLGLGSTDASKGQHCRAEFFAQGIGWVPVDPADVRKVVLEEPPGNLQLDDPRVMAIRRKLFGTWEMNWLAYNTAHDVVLPNSRTRLAYFMYPNGESGGKALDQLDPDTFKYTITAREIKTPV
ncbi:Transglutaminase-like enzyme, putative cysteine protease [Nitrosomonas sp. Nm51]|uniref:transglutaminase-like domain-containing protein n=1 Tax=Nitrosomonas sp. Nm51 TaxID=133720 RepID=UPI0008D30240|nr:transglutaminase domain-containing protein [Nitrosomonas sp. Nm51]SER26655.1 Transglutaminase-like enzyme, putative cysteine protease [Nitrosomonas sp. Nm51]